MSSPSLTLLSELAAHYAPYSWFAALWALSLVAFGVLGVVLVDRVNQVAEAPLRERHANSQPSRSELVLSAVALIALVGLYAFLVLYHEDLVGIDYAQLTGGASPFASVPIWPESGRFFPLGLQEYSILGLFGRSATLFHAFSIVQLVVMLFCVFRILDTTPVWFRCAVAAFMITTPGILHSWFGLVYPERDLLFWLAIWLVCLQAFDRTRSRRSFCGALVAAQFALYYKETAFVLIGVFAATRLVLDAWVAPGLSRPKQFDRFARAHLLELAHLALCAVFLGVYVAVVAGHVTASYVGQRAGESYRALSAFVHTDWLLDAMAIVLGWRVLRSAIDRTKLDLIWEPLALAALVYALAYVKLGLSRDYYLAPADFVAAMYVARVGFYALDSQRMTIRVAAAAAVVLAFQSNVRNAAFEIASRKEFVDGNARLASFLRSYATSHAEQRLSLFFPQAGGFQLMEFSAYLRYRGLSPADTPSNESPSGGSFAVKSPHRYPGDLCQASQAFRCFYDAAPDSNDLVVFLPGRQVSPRDLDALRAAASEVFHDRPEPTIVERMLQTIAPAERMSERPTAEAFVFRY